MRNCCRCVKIVTKKCGKKVGNENSKDAILPCYCAGSKCHGIVHFCLLRWMTRFSLLHSYWGWEGKNSWIYWRSGKTGEMRSLLKGTIEKSPLNCGEIYLFIIFMVFCMSTMNKKELFICSNSREALSMRFPFKISYSSIEHV